MHHQIQLFFQNGNHRFDRVRMFLYFLCDFLNVRRILLTQNRRSSSTRSRCQTSDAFFFIAHEPIVNHHPRNILKPRRLRLKFVFRFSAKPSDSVCENNDFCPFDNLFPTPHVVRRLIRLLLFYPSQQQSNLFLLECLIILIQI